MLGDRTLYLIPETILVSVTRPDWLSLSLLHAHLKHTHTDPRKECGRGEKLLQPNANASLIVTPLSALCSLVAAHTFQGAEAEQESLEGTHSAGRALMEP